MFGNIKLFQFVCLCVVYFGAFKVFKAGCFKGVSWVSQGCLKGISMVASMMFLWCFKGIPSAFLRCFQEP